MKKRAARFTLRIDVVAQGDRVDDVEETTDAPCTCSHCREGRSPYRGSGVTAPRRERVGGSDAHPVYAMREVTRDGEVTKYVVGEAGVAFDTLEAAEAA